MTTDEKALKLHADLKGKLSTEAKYHVKTREDLSLAYTPGVAKPCVEIANNPEDVYKYTWKGNTVAVVSDGSAVLGLGNIGAKAAMPVMEGKAVLFKEFGNVNAVPICLDTQDPDEIVDTVVRISPGFGGINLEDISAPRCFEIENRLKEILDIPVFHDDQHGTAVVVLSGIRNALKLTGKKPEECSVVMSGAGAAGTAIAKLLLTAGFKDITMRNIDGVISSEKTYDDPSLTELASLTNPNHKDGSLADIIKGADIFIGVSAPGLLTEEMIKTMNKDAIIFAMANPVPEVMPEIALAAGARVIATGRSDYPNQINNVLAFPGIFRGTFDVHAKEINDEMKFAAATAIASIIPDDQIRADYIIPEAFNPVVAQTVAAAVAEAAKKSGVTREYKTL